MTQHPDTEKRIGAFVTLGRFLAQFTPSAERDHGSGAESGAAPGVESGAGASTDSGPENPVVPGAGTDDDLRASLKTLNELHYDAFETLIEREHIHNPWFTPDNIRQALEGLVVMLQPSKLEKWLEPYGLAPGKASSEAPPGHRREQADKARHEQERLEDDQPQSLPGVRTIGVVMAGNIPLVGFHDLLCVLLSGHRLLAKTSSKDDRLMRRLAEVLISIDPDLDESIEFTSGKLEGMDAIIATGSNNSARYFEQYFAHLPHIIRKNRNGVAILNGKESREELHALGRDIFSYFGMGCRNVTKLYLPEGYDPKRLMEVMDDFSSLSQHHKYMNNVDYYRSIYLMNQQAFLDNGVLLLKEDAATASPVGVVFYERYSELETLQSRIGVLEQEIQCVISAEPGIPLAVRPGESQQPDPWDYADGVDTLRFLKELI